MANTSEPLPKCPLCGSLPNRRGRSAATPARVGCVNHKCSLWLSPVSEWTWERLCLMRSQIEDRDHQIKELTEARDAAISAIGPATAEAVRLRKRVASLVQTLSEADAEVQRLEAERDNG